MPLVADKLLHFHLQGKSGVTKTRNAKQQNNETGIFFNLIFLCVKQRNRDFSFQLFGSPVSNARANSGQLVPRHLLLSTDGRLVVQEPMFYS